MGAHVYASSEEVLERLHQALNQHDLAGVVACVGPEYRSEQPAHPNRGFGGREQVVTATVRPKAWGRRAHLDVRHRGHWSPVANARTGAGGR